MCIYLCVCVERQRERDINHYWALSVFIFHFLLISSSIGHTPHFQTFSGTKRQIGGTQKLKISMRIPWSLMVFGSWVSWNRKSNKGTLFLFTTDSTWFSFQFHHLYFMFFWRTWMSLQVLSMAQLEESVLVIQFWKIRHICHVRQTTVFVYHEK